MTSVSFESRCRWLRFAVCALIAGCANGTVSQPTDRDRRLETAVLDIDWGEEEQEQPTTAGATLPQAPPTVLTPWVPEQPHDDADPHAGTLDNAAAIAPAQAECGALELTAKPRPSAVHGNVLVVFDRSASMGGKWEKMPKYQAAGDALIAALTPLADQLMVGGLFFPSPDQDGSWLFGLGECGVSPIFGPDQLDFMPAASFIRRLPQLWNLDDMSGTPLQAALARAAEALEGRDLAGPTSVLILTDGEPNCGTKDREVLAQVEAWRRANISTYVVGLPGAKSAAKLLDTMAQAGGHARYLEPRDPEELARELGSVLQTNVRPGFDSCSFALDPVTEAPDKLRLFARQQGSERELPRVEPAGTAWRVSPTGDRVTLEGSLCQAALTGELESLRFVFGCADPVPAPEPSLF